MNNGSNALGFVLIALISIVVATAVTLLFAFGFLPFLATSVIYINITSILLLALTLVFAFILSLKYECPLPCIADDLRALSVLSVISLIFGIVTVGLTLAEPTTAGIRWSWHPGIWKRGMRNCLPGSPEIWRTPGRCTPRPGA